MSSPARQWWCPECLPVKLFFALVTLLPSAFAAPAHELARRDGAGPAAVAIWVPIVGVALFAAASVSLCFFYFRKRQPTTTQPAPQQQPATAPLSLATRLRAWSSRPVHIPGTRELTAEELAGGTTRGLLRGRRRRPGSMASTRSTRSLPPYLKEPGEQEVVVYRGQSEGFVWAIRDVPVGVGAVAPAVEASSWPATEYEWT
ncbi:uncharacterized protein LAESUDRAFT_78946 [Laetiporus sulphureus 93-53]|uniref:Uncharacterized protein n=1 Tax=Laetiporus sulphureus 93-53 TaxID=1314785 RepID=A0A165F1G5_9APHY|nr:uncharacterized protein LAESUDRAFT_78946 [Laetiporus sulphureus 93-53]KZT08171.1 hypothetical protein LAESUDRAFT_78946 [Laetiporus sulphureus 93-53]